MSFDHHSDKKAALGKVLERRGDSQPSSMSDREILNQAEAHCRQQQSRRSALLAWLFAPAGVASNAFASVAVTAMVFLVMAQAVVPVDMPQLNEVESDELQAVVIKNRSMPRIVTSSRPEFESYSPDQVLLEISLPNVADLVKSMEFVAEAERAEATIELIAALADIESSIGVGELGAARQRYVELRERCYACNLPTTLEALALLDLDTAERG